MRFRSFDNLRVFNIVAQHLSVSRAAEALCLSKGAVSYQIKKLEDELGFSVFARNPGGIALTAKGERLWHLSQSSFQQIEKEIEQLREEDNARITIGTTTYFASRWLSSRLMTFINDHPKVSLRLQPMLDLSNLSADNIDMAIRWGTGDWTDAQHERLFPCPAIATASPTVAQTIKEQGLESTLPSLRLLHDSEGSSSWQEWLTAAGLTYEEKSAGLVIPDPNVRVQAVIDGQGLALNDALVAEEIQQQRLCKISAVELKDYGYYLAYTQSALSNPVLQHFREWILEQGETYHAQSA